MNPDELKMWSPEDRSDLFRSVEYLSTDTRNADRVGLCLDTILNDLEVHDDPEQGLGLWLYSNEAALLKELAELLHEIIGSTRIMEAGERAVTHSKFPAVRKTAARLAALMRSNGKTAAIC